ncbi:MAG: hypothetical protein ACT4PK_10755 [Gammaproteobacteria bacterium]
MRWLLLVCALVSAGLVSGPADARSRDQQKQAPENRDEREERRDERQNRREERKRDERQDREELRDGWRDHRRDNQGRTAEAARRAQRLNGGGRVLSVEPDGRGYRVKVLKDGEVRVHHIEPD